MNSLINYLKLLYHSTYLPIQYYKNNNCLLTLPDIEPSYDLSEVFRMKLLETGNQLTYLTTDQFLYYGIIRKIKANEYIIVGPITSTRIKASSIPKILLESSVMLKYKEKVQNFLHLIPVFSYEQFIHFLALLYKELTGQIVEPNIHFGKHEPFPMLENNINKTYQTKIYQTKEESRFHNTYHYEQELYQYVSNGDVSAIEKLINQGWALISGTIGENSLRQEKNILIAAITLLTRASIAGGLDIETAYQLSDTYIQESEKASSIETVKQLAHVSIFDFAKRVAATKIPLGISADVYQCIQYISTHTNQPINVADVASAVGKGRSAISRRFKKELGFNISDFIMRRKLEEGKSLLTYSDKSLSEISEYLCFSSQSYFQNVFKKNYGVTPLKYRQTTKR